MTIIFELLFYSCVTISADGFLGDQVTTCRWSTGGELFATSELCSSAGLAQIGTPVHSFIVEDRRRERHRCIERHVRNQQPPQAGLQ